MDSEKGSSFAGVAVAVINGFSIHECALRAAIAAGDKEAHVHLGVLLSEQTGREAEAESAFRKAIDLGFIPAKLLLAGLLLDQPTRRDEGYTLLREARVIGIPGAHEFQQTFGRNEIIRLTTRIRPPGGLYAAAKEIDGEPRPGSYFLAVLRAIAHHNVFERQFFYEPLSTYEDVVTLCEINDRLTDAHVNYRWMNKITVSFRMFESGRQIPFGPPLGRLLLPSSGEREIEPHCVALCGFDKSEDELIFRNSWGTTWGNKGYGRLSRTYFNKYMVDTWIGRSTRLGPTRFNESHLLKATDANQYARAWKFENPRWRGGDFRQGAFRYRFVIHETISTDGGIAEIVEIRNGIGIKVAWAHLHHRTQHPRITVVKEFYVWPTFRRTAFGTRLEEAACYRARLWHAEKIQILFHKIDAWPRVRAAGRKFAEQMGYDWKWRYAMRPDIEGVAEKAL